MPILGHGIDIVDVPRISGMLAEHGERFLTRCFTPGEQAHGRGSPRYGEHLAARFAAKEAALKALGTGLDAGVSWTEVEVVRHPDGRPELVLHGRAAEIARERGITRWWVSLSHTGTHAMASVLAER